LISKNIYIKLAGYFISFIFLYLTFKDIDIGTVYRYLNVDNVYYLIAAAAINFFFFVVRSFYQINNLHYIKKEITFTESLTSIGIAQFYNVIFPARMGELVRTYFLSKRLGIKKVIVLSYILVEKVMDVLLILALLLLIIVFLIQGDVELVNAISYFSGTVILVIVFLLVYLKFSTVFIQLLKTFIPERMFSAIHSINEEILTGLKFFKSKGQITKSIMLLLFSWISILTVFGLITYPYVQLLDLPIYSCLVFMVFSALSLSIPIAPAGIGVMHYGLFLAVKMLGGEIVDSQTDLVAAFVISTHFFVMLFDVLAGGGIMFLHGLTSNERFFHESEIMKNNV
jgi:glycosyltransferase 2 family protein